MAKSKTAAKIKPKDQHKSGFQVRLPEVYRAKLAKLTETTRRTMTTEVQIAIDKHLAGSGESTAR